LVLCIPPVEHSFLKFKRKTKMKGMGDMVVMLPMILLMNQLNFKDPDIILRTRVVYGIVQVITLLGLAYLYFLISQKNDSKKSMSNLQPQDGQRNPRNQLKQQ